MQYLAQLKVRTRLALGFGTLVALMALLTIVGIQKVNFIDKSLAEVTDINSVKQRYAINFRGSVHDRAIAIRDVSMARKVIAKKKSGEDVTPLLLEQVRPSFASWLKVINEFIDYQESLNQQLTPIARAEANGFQSLMLVLSGIAVLISAMVGFIIERSFRLSLGSEPYVAQHAIQLMANGELTQQHQSSDKGSILHSLSLMSDKLSSIVHNIRNASEQLAMHPLSNKRR